MILLVDTAGRKAKYLSSSFPGSVTIGSASGPMSDSVKDLGVTLDCHLAMKAHNSNLS